MLLLAMGCWKSFLSQLLGNIDTYVLSSLTTNGYDGIYNEYIRVLTPTYIANLIASTQAIRYSHYPNPNPHRSAPPHYT